MKNKLLIALLFAFTICNAQLLKLNLSGSYGPLNSKFRFQVELPIKKRLSYGLNTNYYLKKWTGPTFEPFIRLYGDSTNVEGSFYQAKFIIGSLSELDYNMETTGKRWMTKGFGLSKGKKILMKNNFTFESIVGVRIISSPNFHWSSGDYLMWWFSTGFPLEANMKLGYQF